MKYLLFLLLLLTFSCKSPGVSSLSTFSFDYRNITKESLDGTYWFGKLIVTNVDRQQLAVGFKNGQVGFSRLRDNADIKERLNSVAYYDYIINKDDSIISVNLPDKSIFSGKFMENNGADFSIHTADGKLTSNAIVIYSGILS